LMNGTSRRATRDAISSAKLKIESFANSSPTE
jgi:hypothetical protein